MKIFFSVLKKTLINFTFSTKKVGKINELIPNKMKLACSLF